MILNWLQPKVKDRVLWAVGYLLIKEKINTDIEEDKMERLQSVSEVLTKEKARMNITFGKLKRMVATVYNYYGECYELGSDFDLYDDYKEGRITCLDDMIRLYSVKEITEMYNDIKEKL